MQSISKIRALLLAVCEFAVARKPIAYSTFWPSRILALFQQSPSHLTPAASGSPPGPSCAFRTLNRRASCACTREEAFSSSVESCSHASPSRALFSIALPAATAPSHASLSLAHILNQSAINELIGRHAAARINIPGIRLPKEAETAWPLHPQAPPLPHRRRRFVHTLSQLPSIRPQTELLHLRPLRNGFQSKLLHLLSHLRIVLPCGRRFDETYWLTCGRLSSFGNTNLSLLVVVAWERVA